MTPPPPPQPHKPPLHPRFSWLSLYKTTVGICWGSSQLAPGSCRQGQGGPSAPLREHRARAGAGPVSSRTRKGIVMWPQAATESDCQDPGEHGGAPSCLLGWKPLMKPLCTPLRLHMARITLVSTANELRLQRTTERVGVFFFSYIRHVTRTDSSVMYTLLLPCLKSKTTHTPGLGHEGSHRYHRTKGGVLWRSPSFFLI